MSGARHFQGLATCGSMANGLGVTADISGFLATGTARHTQALIGAIRITTGMRMDGTTTRATGTAKIMATTTGSTTTMTTTATIGANT